MFYKKNFEELSLYAYYFSLYNSCQLNVLEKIPNIGDIGDKYLILNSQW